MKVNLNRKVACPKGTFLPTTGASNESECLECPQGFFQNWVGQTVCLACPAGRHVAYVGKNSADHCEDCPCGHYCPAASPIATACEAGTFTKNIRMMENDSCIPCPPGSACPEATCDPECYLCPAGRWNNQTGVPANGSDCSFHGFEAPCELCLPGFFCPEGSVVPTACPAGTFAGDGTPAEENCTDCPVGYRCSVPAENWTKHSLVHLDPSGFPVVGSPEPESCEVDVTEVHYSHPSYTGCEEGCPFQLPRQAFCHVAGDGRIPNRDKEALAVADLLARRNTGGRTLPASQDHVLGKLSEMLDGLEAEVVASVLSLPDENGRTPLMRAAMVDDVPLLEVLDANGIGDTLAARDLGGFTALMHALRFDNQDATQWLVDIAGAALYPGDAETMEGLGVDISGIPMDTAQPSTDFIGGGGLTWTHPSGEDFVDSPLPPGLQ